VDRSNRFLTVVLAIGSGVLLLAIGIGERMGDRVLGQATESNLQSVPVVVSSPVPSGSPVPYGPDWQRSDTLTAAGDPRFPDPRVPPQPLPTPLPTPKATPTPVPSPATPTPNPNIPIWRQQPLPTATPIVQPGPTESASPGERRPESPSPEPP
jgi:hypothetical protein